jgi:hypothetical protein
MRGVLAPLSLYTFTARKQAILEAERRYNKMPWMLDDFPSVGPLVALHSRTAQGDGVRAPVD